MAIWGGGYYRYNPYGLNFSRSYPRVGVYNGQQNFGVINTDDGNDILAVAPDGRKYTKDDLRYLNKKRVYGSGAGWLIPSSLLVSGVEMLSPLSAGNPLGSKHPGARAVANLAGFATNTSSLVGGISNLLGWDNYKEEKKLREAAGTDLAMPDRADLDYMNAKLRYENSFTGRHPVLSGLLLDSNLSHDLVRGIQPRGRAFKYTLGSMLPLIGGAAVSAINGDLTPLIAGIGGSALTGIAADSIYNVRGKKKFLAEKAARQAAGKLY